ncbi:MAG: DEAD/DEAH box helicase [Desulfatitalea sp.]|nr:DEAD/DEAH box helicase [Desulfatitalea sp.]NNK02640.1 DEAD/DEAH box helicase [Desulfatitalea sp.]
MTKLTSATRHDSASKPFRLRPYQKMAVAAVVSRYQEAHQRRMLLYLPTGAGKTVIATHIIKALRTGNTFGKVLFVAHRREIINQTAHTIGRHLPRLKVQIEQGKRSARGNGDITLASVQSLVRRKEKYDPKAYALIICDECHRALSPSWGEVIDYFHTRTDQNTLLLGMTATPQRTDGRSALDVFGRTAFEITRTELEDLGYLVPMQYFTVGSHLNLDHLKMSAGDFQVGALSRVMNAPATRALTLQAWFEQGQGRKTIVFCAGVEHAGQLAADFSAMGISAEKIDGKSKDRGEILNRFDKGQIQVLTNYGVLTEGFDDPTVACILMARPTTSPLVYTQCIGRGLRTAPGKAACVVIDIVDRSTHQLQYGATQMAGLPKKWQSRGADPFRQARSFSGIKVTCTDAFLRLREASSLEEVQSILMRLPPEVVTAGLDGEPVLHYEPGEQDCTISRARESIREILKQAGCVGARLQIDETTVRIQFREPETQNERYAYLKWHLKRATCRHVVYEPPNRKNGAVSPRTLLRSMLPEGCRVSNLAANTRNNTITATVSGLTPDLIQRVQADFEDEYGMALDLQGQMSLF